MAKYILRFPLTAIGDDGGEISYSDFNENEKKDLSSCMSLNLCFDPGINGWDEDEVQITKIEVYYNGINKIPGEDFGYELTSEGLEGYPAPIVSFELNKDVDAEEFRTTIFESSFSVITKKMKEEDREPFIAEDHNGYVTLISEAELEYWKKTLGNAALIPPKVFSFEDGMPQYGHFFPLKSLKKASNEFQNEIDQVMNEEEKEEIPKTLENLRNVILEDVRKDGWLLKDVDKKFKSDREIVLAAVSQEGCALEFACKKFKSDREIVLAAVSQDGGAIEHADKEFKSDREIVLEAVRSNGWSIMHVDSKFKSDREIVFIAFECAQGQTIIDAAEEAGIALKTDCDLIKFANKILKEELEKEGLLN